MNQLQIVEAVFASETLGNLCFTPVLKISGDREYLSAKCKLSHHSDWSPAFLEYSQKLAEKLGYKLGVDFIEKSFTFHKIN
jgi:hypothetical protein